MAKLNSVDFFEAVASAQPGVLKEFDPTGSSPHTNGAKLDGGKSPVFRGALNYFPKALMAVAQVSEFGAKKYLWKGWKTVPEAYERYSDAMIRHVCYEESEDYDPDSNLLHAAHAAWNALARLEKLIEKLPTTNPSD